MVPSKLTKILQDLFDMSDDAIEDLAKRREAAVAGDGPAAECDLGRSPAPKQPKQPKQRRGFISTLPSSHAYLPALTRGLSRLRDHPTLVMGVQSDTLFPIEQQRELAECIRANGNDNVVYYELNQPYGHDTFLLDVPNVGGAIRGFLESDM